MHTFDYKTTPKSLLTPEIVSLISDIREYRGKQELYETAHADVLNTLLKVAKIQSADSSNRIEGITITNRRLLELVEKKTMPKTRNEQEIAGYRDVLETIHGNYEFIPVRPNAILQLHRDLYSSMPQGIGGHWKMSDNFIQETDAAGETFVRFQPVSAVETAQAMEDLCSAYRQAVLDAEVDVVLLSAMFVFDFLCIHPFHDGNGRMSRLLTLLLLYQGRYIVGKYISIEKAIEESKETYYESLKESSSGWNSSENNYVPFVSYMLGVILKAYRELERRVSGLIDFKKTKNARVREAFEDTLKPLSKKDIQMLCPDISLGMITLTLQQMLKEGLIAKTGRGRGTRYFKKVES